jgi:hypothetical protein
VSPIPSADWDARAAGDREWQPNRAGSHAPADNIVHDVVSIQYRVLKALPERVGHGFDSAGRRLMPANGGTPRSVYENLPTIADLDGLTELVTTSSEEDQLFVRWSAGPAVDLRRDGSSRDSLTGVPLPGLSANPLAVERWWGDRSLRLWVARRLYDYRHLRYLRGAD